MTIHPKQAKWKRNIEWAQVSWNWMSGCDGVDGVHCKGCYAKVMAIRVRGRFGYPKDDPFRVVLHPDKLWGYQPSYLPAWTKQQTPMINGPFVKWPKHPMVRKKPSVFFSVSQGDWLYAESNWRREALRIMEACPQHIFVTLTKQYDRLGRIHVDSPLTEGVGIVPLSYKIPRNVIVGISVTKKNQVHGIDELRKVPALVRLVCFEPLLEDVSEDVDLNGIGWIIIGKRTKQHRTPAFIPEKAWIDALIAKARELDIPVFLKPNLPKWYPEPIEETPYDYIRATIHAEEPRLVQGRLGFPIFPKFRYVDPEGEGIGDLEFTCRECGHVIKRESANIDDSGWALPLIRPAERTVCRNCQTKYRLYVDIYFKKEDEA